jgi:hypothetical protein
VLQLSAAAMLLYFTKVPTPIYFSFRAASCSSRSARNRAMFLITASASARGQLRRRALCRWPGARAQRPSAAWGGDAERALQRLIEAERLDPLPPLQADVHSARSCRVADGPPLPGSRSIATAPVATTAAAFWLPHSGRPVSA